MTDDNLNENSEVYNQYQELSKPTEDDFKRVFTEDELKELCLKHKCGVDMWRWNVVNDYRILFTESGRFQRWSPSNRLRMLAKAVNKMKPSVLYDEEEIRETRKEEWGLQLKENILSLNFWKRKRLHNCRLVTTESDNIDREVELQCEVNTESMNMNELLTQRETQQSEVGNVPTSYRELDQEVQLQIEVNTESMNVAELLTQSQSQEPLGAKTITYKQFEKDTISRNEANTVSNNLGQLVRQSFVNEDSLETMQLTNGEATPSKHIEIEEDNILLADMDVDFLIEEDSENSVETVLLNEHQKRQDVQILDSEEIAPEVQNIYDVSTMSMTIDSEIYTQSQDVLPTNYDNFRNIIPLTSTQSQNRESEDILVA